MKSLFLALAMIGVSGAAQAASCNAPPVLEAPMPASPFGAVASADGCTLFVSMNGNPQGEVTAYRRDSAQLLRLGSVPRTGFGAMALSHDGSLLIAPTADGAMVIDARKLAAKEDGAVLATIQDGGKDADYVALSSDDATLFISDEHSGGISVIDFAKARASGFKDIPQIGTIRVGNAPVGLALSKDGRTLFATVQVFPVPQSPQNCAAENGGGRQHRQGALLAIDIDRARTDTAHAVVGGSFAGCNPVRVALSPAGDKAYVTARGSDQLLVLDTAKILAGSTDAVTATAPVGTSPVGVAVNKDGSRIYVANSDRFGTDKSQPQTLSVLAADKIGTPNPQAGTIPVGAIPRELTVTPDGALVVACAGSRSLMVIDLARTP